MASAVPLVIAHRGASRAHPENTVAAFRGAAAMGADMVELDVRRTADRALVVLHDAHLPDGRALVDLPARELPPSIPTLEAAVEACAGMSVNIEVKSDPRDPDFDAAQWVAGEVARYIGGAGLHDRVLVSSFHPGAIEQVRSVDAGIATAWLTSRIADAAATARWLVEGGHIALHPFDAAVDAALVEVMHDSGRRVNVWTVDDPARMAQLAALGVDGICTNVPDVAIALLRPRPG